MPGAVLTGGRCTESFTVKCVSDRSRRSASTPKLIDAGPQSLEVLQLLVSCDRSNHFVSVLVLTLPVNIMTLGLFTFIINAAMLWIASSVVPGFEIIGVVPAVMGAIILWLIGWGANTLIRHAKSS